jgi:hypothetical protein
VLTLLTLAALAIGLVLLFGVLSFLLHLVGFVITLPFRILGWTFRLVGLVFLVVLGVLTAILAGGVLLLPLLPLALVALGVAWLFRRRRRFAPN